MKKQIILLALLFSAVITHAQMSSIPLKYYAEFKKRTLIVVVEEPRADLLGKLDAEQQAVYKQEIEEYNTLTKWAMDTYYKTSNPVEYKTRTEVEPIIKNKDKAYAILENVKFSEFYESKMGFEQVQKNRFIKEQNHLNGALFVKSLISRIDIRFAENHESYIPELGEYFPNPFPTKAETAYVFKQIAATLDLREKGIDYNKEEKHIKSEKKLKSLTLLISENDMDSKEDREKFLKAYPNPVEIVSKEKFEEAILNNDARYAAVFTVPTINTDTEDMQFYFFVYDCGSGLTLTKSVPQEKIGVSVGGGGLSALKAIKKVTTESRVPGLTKENMMDFASAPK